MSSLAIGLTLSPSAPADKKSFGFVTWLMRTMERMKQRQALMEMDERMLNDIGITRWEAVYEGRKSFWQA